MLVQSSVLIMILLAVDFLLHKKVRAVFRYWLWLLVLAKLILPPVLSFPVSIGRFVAAPVAAVTAVNKPFIEPHHFH
jgi:beta-lactamase regulating signal transducer with metallopeptidase domain